MGDRFIINKKCPRCGEVYEVYDAPSSMMYVAKCKCGYDENMSYYELNDHLYLVPDKIRDYIFTLEGQVDSLIEELSEAFDVVN